MARAMHAATGSSMRPVPGVVTSSDPGYNWGAIKRNGLQHAYLGDVYPVNIFSWSRLDALPPERLQALRQAMQIHGLAQNSMAK